MFKIQKSSNGKSVVFSLSGRIKGAVLAELQKLLKGEAGDIALDLKEVKLVKSRRGDFSGLLRSERHEGRELPPIYLRMD